MPLDTTAATETVVLAPTDLTALTSADLYRRAAHLNTAHAAAEAAYVTAQDNLCVLLTEQATRHVLAAHPQAAMLFVRAVAEYHHDTDGNPVPGCEGHNARLAPDEVLDADGDVLGHLDPLSPVVYLLERLSDLLGVEDQVLDIETREWAIDCTND